MNFTSMSLERLENIWGRNSLKCQHSRPVVRILLQLELITGPETSVGLFLIPVTDLLFWFIPAQYNCQWMNICLTLFCYMCNSYLNYFVPQKHRTSPGDDEGHLGKVDYFIHFVLRTFSAGLTQFGEQRTEVSLHLSYQSTLNQIHRLGQTTLDFTCNLVLVSGLGFHGYR